jgi:hypothetical protein
VPIIQLPARLDRYSACFIDNKHSVFSAPIFLVSQKLA